MCGIAGIFDMSSGEPVEPDAVERMIRTIAHRGPDASGVVGVPGGALGAARLAIFDLRPEVKQPLVSRDGLVSLAYNGEIFNHPELRAELESLGHRFATHCDTEVVLEAYREWGPGAVERFNGMWAFALYDRERDLLFCSRDRFGAKPFFYTRLRGRFLFASEVKALLAVHRELASPNPAQLRRLFEGFDAPEDESTYFESVQQLLPAHNLLVTRDEIQLQRYWSYPVEPLEGIGRGEAGERVRELLHDAVRLRLRSDVPIAVTLSGGIDSAGILALVREHDSGPLETFTATFPGDEMDEGPRSAWLAERMGTLHTEIPVRIDDFLPTLHGVVRDTSAPEPIPSAVPQRMVMEAIHGRGIKVALEGQAADELFGGYEQAIAPAIVRDRLRDRDLVGALREFRDISALWGTAALLNRFGRLALPRLHRRLRMLRGDERVLAGEFRGESPASSEPPPHFRDALTAALHGSHTGMLRRLLFKGDAVSMAHSVELRAPFLDYRLVELGFRLPSAIKAGGGLTKIPVRDALRDLLPEEMLVRGRKQAFFLPVRSWFRERPKELIEPFLLDERCRRRGVFDPKAVETVVMRHLGGRFDLSLQLFGMVSTEMWFREFIDGA